MSSEHARSRCRERISRLADSSLDSAGLRHEAARELQRAIGFDLWCWGLADPTSLIPYGGVASLSPPEVVAQVLPRLLALEQQDPTIARHEVARSRRPVYTLSEATGGELERCRRWAECIGPLGLGDLAVGACRDASGCWGWLEAYRTSDNASFSPEETALLADVVPALGDALRRRAISREPLVERRPPGVLILDEDMRAMSWTSSARAWIGVLPGRIHEGLGLLPSVVYAVAGRASAPSGSAAARLGARAGARTDAGYWAILEGELLHGAGRGHVAITIRSANPAEALELLARIHRLTARERELAHLVVRGLSTAHIAARLVISPHTAKDHLKAIFEKTGARSRGELVARIHGVNPVDGRAVSSAARLPKDELTRRESADAQP